jgi:hypothetical protein
MTDADTFRRYVSDDYSQVVTVNTNTPKGQWNARITIPEWNLYSKESHFLGKPPLPKHIRVETNLGLTALKEGGSRTIKAQWTSTGKKVTVSQKGSDGKMHKVSRTTYKNASKPGELRIARTGTDGKRKYVKFKVAEDKPKKKSAASKKK